MRIVEKEYAMSQASAHLKKNAPKLDLTFAAHMGTVEGILTLVQEWSAEQGASYDDKLSLRLILEELLSNICIHATPSEQNIKIRLRIEPSNHEAKVEFHVVLWDNGAPFNPLRENDIPVDTIENTLVGRRGLSLVRLLTNNTSYSRNNGNQFSFTYSSDAESQDTYIDQEEQSNNSSHISFGARLRHLWRNNLAFRQTTFFTLYACLLIWCGIGLFYFGTKKLLHDNATTLGMQAMHTQAVISSTFMQRVQSHLDILAQSLVPTHGQMADHNERKTKSASDAHTENSAKLFANNALQLYKELLDNPRIASLAAEIPVVGIMAGKGQDAWFFGIEKGLISHKYPINNIDDFIAPLQKAGTWQTLLLPLQQEEGYLTAMTKALAKDVVQDLSLTPSTHDYWEDNSLAFDPNAAMIYCVPLPFAQSKIEKTAQDADAPKQERLKQATVQTTEQNFHITQDAWLGIVITMPWIAKTLKQLSGFTHAHPIFLDGTGQYVIFPPGRSMHEGPQSLSQDAENATLPLLASLEKDILSGKKGIVQLQSYLGTKRLPWQISWQAPTSLIYHPMTFADWHLAMLVNSYELGNAPLPFPQSFLFMALLGPLAIAIITWCITSRTLSPLASLTIAIRKLSQGDTDSPFPKAHFPDEIDNMLKAFDRVRVTLRTSFRTLILNATKQQRLDNELDIARSTQQSMLPHSLPQVPGIDIAAGIDMAREVCGDLYTCFVHPQKPTQMYFMMGDVCGKGIPAALIMSRAVSLARSFLVDGSPSSTLERLNDALLRVDSTAMFVTMLVATLDTESGVFQWASAGHPPPLWAANEKSHTQENTLPIPLEWSKELVLNVYPDQKYTTFTLTLEPGQALLLYTDGASEAMGPPSEHQEELYGEERLYSTFLHAWRENSDAESILEYIRKDIQKHMGEQAPADDISLLVISRKK